MSEKEPLEFDPRFYRMLVKTAIGTNPIRILVELILNSADSYERLQQVLQVNPPFQIFVAYSKSKRTAELKVKDDAEGMDYKKLRDALKYGAPTSGIVGGAPVRGALGFGLKDSLMAMDDATIISVKDGKISEAKVVFEEGRPFVDYLRKNEKVTAEERGKLGISGNGTIVRGIFPRKEFAKEFKKIFTFKEVKELLPLHFMMRKLLQLPEYSVQLFWGREYVPQFPHTKLVYKPQDGELVHKEEFTVVDSDRRLKASLNVKKAQNDLRQSGEFRQGGLLHSYSKFGVVDCTLWGFDNEPLSQKLFGEVIIEGLEPYLGEEDVIDPKRKGLNKKHPLVEELARAIEERLRKLVEKEREAREVARYSFDKLTKRQALMELSRIARKLTGPGPRPPPIEKCDTILLYPHTIDLREWKEKYAYVFINQKMLESDSKIRLKSTSNEIEVRPREIKLTRADFQTEFISKSIRLLGKRAGAKGEIRAEMGEFSDALHVEVEENPQLSPSNGFAFVPPETTVVDKNVKNTELVVDLSLIRGSNLHKVIRFQSDNPKIISCSSKYEIPKKLKKFVVAGKVVVLPIAVKGKGIGKEGNILATYKNKQATLKVRVIEPFEIGGMFKDIDITQVGKRVCYFNREEGIIYVNVKHPLTEKYLKSKKRRKESFLVFVADAISRTACEEIVKRGVERESPQFPIFDYSRKEEDVKNYIHETYFEWGPKLHDILTPLVKTLKIA